MSLADAKEALMAYLRATRKASGAELEEAGYSGGDSIIAEVLEGAAVGSQTQRREEFGGRRLRRRLIVLLRRWRYGEVIDCTERNIVEYDKLYLWACGSREILMRAVVASGNRIGLELGIHFHWNSGTAVPTPTE